MAKTEKYYTGLALNFGQTIRNWAAQSAQQLRDAYAMQKVWDGRKSNAVWSGKRRSHYKDVNDTTKGRVQINSWWDENYWRMRQAHSGPHYSAKGKPLEYWYSTGESYRISQSNPVTVIDDSLASGTVDFHTTMGALYTEAGVGLTGRGYVRGKHGSKGRKRIKVDREKPYTHKQRYVGEWKPMAGHTHRPNTRQQVNLLARRLKWAAQIVYHHELSVYIAYELERTFMEMGNVAWVPGPGGLPTGVYVEGKNKNKQVTWAEYLEQHRGYDAAK